jgi:hypothetical protein
VARFGPFDGAGTYAKLLALRRLAIRLIETSCGMRDLVVASLRCNELAREPSAGRWVWLVNEVPARCIRSVVWLERGETPSI